MTRVVTLFVIWIQRRGRADAAAQDADGVAELHLPRDVAFPAIEAIDVPIAAHNHHLYRLFVLWTIVCYNKLVCDGYSCYRLICCKSKP